ncbi:MAG: hypothetical protein ACOX7N_02270 [Lawsonibacter sp.]|jgi:hypothetical protein
MKKRWPWYVWLSVVGFAYLMCRLEWELAQWDQEQGTGENHWLPFLGRCLYLFAGQVLLPSALAMEAWRRVAWSNGEWRLGTLLLVWLLVYATGVVATWRLECWRRELEEE